VLVTLLPVAFSGREFNSAAISTVTRSSQLCQIDAAGWRRVADG
jgi:hypothetical protein